MPAAAATSTTSGNAGLASSPGAAAPEWKPESGKKVAVIGGGPGGLSAAGSSLLAMGPSSRDKESAESCERIPTSASRKILEPRSAHQEDGRQIDLKK
jgi:hypothetical protein